MPFQIIAIGILAASEQGGQPTAAGVVVGLALYCVGLLAQIVVQAFFAIGLLQCLLDIARGNEVDIADLFRGGRKFLRGVGAMLLWAFAFVAFYIVMFGVPAMTIFALTPLLDGPPEPGLIVLIIGAVVGWLLLWFVVMTSYMLTYGFFMPALVDRDCGVLESYRVSRQITRGNRLVLFAVGLVFGICVYGPLGVFYVMLAVGVMNQMVGLAILGGLGFLCCILIMVFVIVPFAAVFYATAYLSMAGQAVGHQHGERPRPRFAIPPFAASTPYSMPYPPGDYQTRFVDPSKKEW